MHEPWIAHRATFDGGATMSFKLLSYIDIPDGLMVRRVSLYEGELTAIPPAHRTDILIVSAFPDDYIPTRTSLIGALERSGLSVGSLAQSKAHDLRSTCAFWISNPIVGPASHLNIERVACYEPSVRGEPPSLVGDLFRGFYPFLDDANEQTVMLPVLASGDQGWPKEAMLNSILQAATHWLARGLPIRELKIVERDNVQAQSLANEMEKFKKNWSVDAPKDQQKRAYDVFLSFSKHDAEAAKAVKTELKQQGKAESVFDYRMAINKGVSWQEEIDQAIANSKAVIALLSCSYFASPECREELMQARLRNKRSSTPILFPIYWSDRGEELALWLQAVNYSDCRERRLELLADAVADLCLDSTRSS